MSKPSVQILNQIFTSAVNAVLPQQLIRSAIRFESQDGILNIRLRQADSDQLKWHKIRMVDRDVFLFGAGKFWIKSVHIIQNYP